MAAKSSPDLSLSLIPQSHAMAATVAANGCRWLGLLSHLDEFDIFAQHGVDEG